MSCNCAGSHSTTLWNVQSCLTLWLVLKPQIYSFDVWTCYHSSVSSKWLPWLISIADCVTIILWHCIMASLSCGGWNGVASSSLSTQGMPSLPAFNTDTATMCGMGWNNELWRSHICSTQTTPTQHTSKLCFCCSRFFFKHIRLHVNAKQQETTINYYSMLKSLKKIDHRWSFTCVRH